MSLTTKLIILVISAIALAMVGGYLIAFQNGVWILLGVSLLLLVLVVAVLCAKSIAYQVENQYYWYEQLLDALPTPISVTDLDMKWTFINKPVASLFKREKQDFIGNSCSQWDTSICNTENCGVHLANQGISETFFNQFGREFRVDTQFLYDLKGNKTGHAEVCTDITAMLEVAKANQQEKLVNNRLKSVNKELKEAQKSLVESEKMASLGMLVAGISHEINTPVGVCVTAASIQLEGLNAFKSKVASNKLTKSDLDSFIKEVAETNYLINNNINRTASLVKSFKQVAVDQTSEARYNFNLDELLHQVITSLQHELKKVRATVEINCEQDLDLYNYPSAFIQTITNLVLNSVIHGFEDTEQGNLIVINVSKADGKVCIDYFDNGKGIEEELLAKLFEPFVTSKRGKGGTGLGTHIAYNLIVHKLNGSIKCTSTLGDGCHFAIKVPLHNDHKNPSFVDLNEGSSDMLIDTKVTFE